MNPMHKYQQMKFPDEVLQNEVAPLKKNGKAEKYSSCRKRGPVA